MVAHTREFPTFHRTPLSPLLTREKSIWAAEKKRVSQSVVRCSVLVHDFLDTRNGVYLYAILVCINLIFISNRKPPTARGEPFQESRNGNLVNTSSRKGAQK